MRSLFAFSAAGRRVVFIAVSIGVCLFGIGARDARADIIVASAGVVDEGGGVFRWYYEAAVGPTQEIRTGSIFSIYDFFGYIPGSEQATFDDLETPLPGWTFLATTFTPIAVCPAGPPCASLSDPNPPNDPAIPDLTWEYTGPTIPSSTPGPANTPLGIFSAASGFGEETAVSAWFAGLAYSESQPGTDTKPLVFNSEEGVDVPSNPVPEPGSMLLLASGLFGAAAMIRRRRRAQV